MNWDLTTNNQIYYSTAMDNLLTLEPILRSSSFFGAMILIGLLEGLFPFRKFAISKFTRWRRHLSLVITNTLLTRLIFPILPISVALLAENSNFGLFQLLSLPLAFQIVLTILILEIIIYFQHVIFHRLPWLWKLHEIHHSDMDFDVTTALRFHPLEIIISLGIKIAAVWLLGAPAWGVIVFEIILNVAAMFTHGNIQLPAKIDYYLRFVFVTPDMHRIHHSTTIAESDSNFGFNLSICDRLFGTYRANPALGQNNMIIGLEQMRDDSQMTLPKLLLLPFIKRS